MNKKQIKLPQHMITGEYIITQAANCHVTIRKKNRDGIIFHAQCNEVLDNEGMQNMLDLYLELKNDIKEDEGE